MPSIPYTYTTTVTVDTEVIDRLNELYHQIYDIYPGLGNYSLEQRRLDGYWYIMSQRAVSANEQHAEPLDPKLGYTGPTGDVL